MRLPTVTGRGDAGCSCDHASAERTNNEHATTTREDQIVHGKRLRIRLAVPRQPQHFAFIGRFLLTTHETARAVSGR
jgi:hypothetical protein